MWQHNQCQSEVCVRFNTYVLLSSIELRTFAQNDRGRIWRTVLSYVYTQYVYHVSFSYIIPLFFHSYTHVIHPSFFLNHSFSIPILLKAQPLYITHLGDFSYSLRWVLVSQHACIYCTDRLQQPVLTHCLSGWPAAERVAHWVRSQKRNINPTQAFWAAEVGPESNSNFTIRVRKTGFKRFKSCSFCGKYELSNKKPPT